MKNMELAYRSLFKKGRSNGIKILSLAIGLAMGLVLIAKIYLEQSFDTFYPDNERIYLIQTQVNREGKTDSYGQVSGGVAPGMKDEIPEVEVATRYTWMAGNDNLLTADKRKVVGRGVIYADSSFFDVLPQKVLIGDMKELMTRPRYVMVSRSFAERVGGVDKAVGQIYTRDSQPGVTYTIGGVFENVPENSHVRYEIIVSLATMNEWSLNNWMGNDRYRAYVKLRPGVSPDGLAPAILAMQARHQNMEAMKEAGVDLTYTLLPLSHIHSKSKEVKEMNRMLGFLAFALILTAVLNYLLIVVSTLIGQTKEVAVHKCYGASGRNILGLIMSESVLHLLISLGLAVLTILAAKGIIEELLSASLGALFSPPALLVLLSICLGVFLITSVVPAYLNIRIPVMYAFRQVREAKRYWKLGLLFVQFTATAFLVVLLLVINKQYDRMVNDNPGYVTENLFYVPLWGTDEAQRKRVFDELERLPDVDKISSSYSLPFWGQSGNNVFEPGNTTQLFNAADMYYVTENYFTTMQIPIVDGKAFGSDIDNESAIMISRSFAKKMETSAGWSGSPLGKGLIITEHSEVDSTTQKVFTICGVYEDFRIQSIQRSDPRPTMFFYKKEIENVMMIRLNNTNAESLKHISEALTRALPEKELEAVSIQSEMINLYKESRRFRDSIMICGIVTLFIAVIGLMGYTIDETNRRRREIAIRKINGATTRSVLQMISRDISYVALPALAIGVLIAYRTGEEWMQQFSEKAFLSPFLFIGGLAALYLMALTCVAFRAWRAATDNPVNSLKAE